MNEPVADAVRGILDGHVVLSRKLAGRGHYPAIDILQSVSRVMSDIVDPETLRMAQEIREILGQYQEVEDLITIGAYKPGQNPRADRAVRLYQPVIDFLKQSALAGCSLEDSWRSMREILAS